MRVSLSKQFSNHLNVLRRGRLQCYGAAVSLVEQRNGLEIGGPSDVFRKWPAALPIYEKVASLDNCDFSPATRWSQHQKSFVFTRDKPPGKAICCEGSDLWPIADRSYDFVLSSHSLEHHANPLKALKEWKRVTRPLGGLILVLPDYAKTFDHRRRPTPLAHFVEDFVRDTQEDDLTHLPEILEHHDFSKDPDVASQAEFRERSLRNFEFRCLHHHVFNEVNSRELLEEAGLTVLSVEKAWPNHIFLVARF